MYFRRFFCSVAVCAVVLSANSLAQAPNAPNNTNTTGGNSAIQAGGGVLIDPQGVLRLMNSDARLTFSAFACCQTNSATTASSAKQAV